MSGAEILTFCRARLDDEERLAWDVNAHDHGKPERWWLLDEPVNPDPPMNGSVHVYGYFMCVHLHRVRPNMARHVAYHCPEKVLAAVAADRAILDEHSDQHECTDLRAAAYPYEGCRTLRLLASRWSWHAEYRTEEWAP